jgi:hypothetical protein
MSILPEDKMREMVEGISKKLHSAGFYFMTDEIEPGFGYQSYPSAKVHSRSLIILGSFDFTYYHELEFVFRDVAWHDLPPKAYWSDHWEKPQLELLSQEEKAQKGLDAHEGYLFAFNIGSFSELRYYIVAKRLFINEGTVFYYDRAAQEPLKPGERVAWWVTQKTKDSAPD